MKATLTGMACAVVVLTAACSSPTTATQGNQGPVKVGLVVSTSGPLAAYGQQYLQGFRAGLDYATGGTGKAAGRTIEVIEADDAGDPAKAVSAVKDAIGKGARVIGGTVSSGVAVQVAPLAAQNKVLYLCGPATTDAISGVNRYTFRSGRQTGQDLKTTQALAGDTKGKKIVVFAQDNTFGQANLAAVTAANTASGATVSGILVPVTAADFTPFAVQARNAKPDLLAVAWAGTTASAMWQALQQQGALDTTVVTGLDLRSSYPTLAGVAGQLTLAAHYFAEAASNPVSQAMSARVTATGGIVDLFTADGFVAAQMLVRAIEAGGDDPDKMITALEGWSFDAPKGRQTIRAQDHAMLQPMYHAKLASSGGQLIPAVVRTLSAEETAPPVAVMK